MSEYGAFTVMSIVGEVKIEADERALQFSNDDEMAKPYYLWC
ncbi:MAG TPA: hypothetical protein OIM39_07945 [Bacteroidaceae bacterium]|nr:hypothetical protein [Bacteroidaceae bacterium]